MIYATGLLLSVLAFGVGGFFAVSGTALAVNASILAMTSSGIYQSAIGYLLFGMIAGGTGAGIGTSGYFLLQKIGSSLVVDEIFQVWKSNYRHKLRLLMNKHEDMSYIHTDWEIEKEILNNSNPPNFSHINNADMIKSYVESIKCIHQLRNILPSLCIVGIVGMHNAGKSTFLKTQFGFDTNPRADIRTEIPTPYKLPQFPVLFVDFPGTDEYMIPVENKWLMKIFSCLILFSTTEIGVSDHLMQIKNLAIEFNIPHLVCFNKAERFFEDQKKT